MFGCSLRSIDRRIQHHFAERVRSQVKGKGEFVIIVHKGSGKKTELLISKPAQHQQMIFECRLLYCPPNIERCLQRSLTSMVNIPETEPFESRPLWRFFNPEFSFTKRQIGLLLLLLGGTGFLLLLLLDVVGMGREGGFGPA